jgi:hypothetical protein
MHRTLHLAKCLASIGSRVDHHYASLIAIVGFLRSWAGSYCSPETVQRTWLRKGELFSHESMEVVGSLPMRGNCKFYNGVMSHPLVISPTAVLVSCEPAVNVRLIANSRKNSRIGTWDPPWDPRLGRHCPRLPRAQTARLSEYLHSNSLLCKWSYWAAR